MADLLDFEAIKTRIEARLVFKATVHKQGVRQEALRGLHYLFLSGEEMPRGDFKPMLGVSDRDATDALGALVKRGLLNSDSPQGKVRFGPVRSGLVWFGLVWFGLVWFGLVWFGLPQHALRFMFPQVWPEAEAEADSANV